MPYVIIHGRGLEGLGSTDSELRKQIIQDSIVVLTKANQCAKQVADEAVARSTLLTRSRTKEWADTFKASVEDMVVRLLTVGASGKFAFEMNPSLITTVAKYIEDEAATMKDMQTELLGISAGLRQASGAVAAKAGEAAAEAARSAAKAAMENFAKDPLGTSMVGLGVAAVGLVFAAYVWRSFR